jgi:hypothetical protein
MDNMLNMEKILKLFATKPKFFDILIEQKTISSYCPFKEKSVFCTGIFVILKNFPKGNFFNSNP